MPKRGTLLTDFEMGKITGLHEDGKSVTEIADALGRSYNCIGNFLKRKRPYTHGGGHQEKLNERTKRQIVRALSMRDPPSLRKLITQLKLEVSKETVRKFFQKNGFKYVNCVKASGKCYENVGDVKEAIIAVWDSLEIDEVRKLVMSFPK